MLRTNRQSGFTLIELLVVISIIGLLSSIVLASLTAAKGKANDAAIKQEISNMRNVLEQNYIDYGGYCALQPGYPYINPSDCSVNNAWAFVGNYSSQTMTECASIVSKSATNPIFGTTRAYFGNGPADATWNPATGISSDCSHYSIEAWLPYRGAWYCVGSGGTSYATTVSGAYNLPGCYNNP